MSREGAVAEAERESLRQLKSLAAALADPAVPTRSVKGESSGQPAQNREPLRTRVQPVEPEMTLRPVDEPYPGALPCPFPEIQQPAVGFPAFETRLEIRPLPPDRIEDSGPALGLTVEATLQHLSAMIPLPGAPALPMARIRTIRPVGRVVVRLIESPRR